ncbi:MAG: HNH/ENDO VII family nuclease [Turicibacter sp.]|nr:HNH/ENDO VII family nuclease [Turicibacter sp.]
MEKFELVDFVNIERANLEANRLNANFPTRIFAENGFFGRIDGFSGILSRESGWSTDITDFIRSTDEFRIYERARLTETDIGGRRALTRNDINWFQVDEFGRTNLQRIENGLAPLDTRNQSIELHHIGQERNSPLAELTIDEHRRGGNSGVLHPSGTSDVHGEGSNWQVEREQYWRDRAAADITARQTSTLTLRLAHEAGVREGVQTAIIVGAISTVDNVRGVFNGDITVQEAAVNVCIDAGAAAALAYGTSFVSTAVATVSAKSAHSVIRTLGSAGVTSTVISFGITSYDSAINFAQGNISGAEFARDLGENAAGVAGAMAGASIGSSIGIVAGPVGMMAGGFVGGMIGYLIAVEAYATILEAANNGVGVISDRAIELRDRAVETGRSVLDFVTENSPQAVETVRTALNDFAANLRVPISVG